MVSRVFDERPRKGGALDAAPGSWVGVCPKGCLTTPTTLYMAMLFHMAISAKRDQVVERVVPLLAPADFVMDLEIPK